MTRPRLRPLTLALALAPLACADETAGAAEVGASASGPSEADDALDTGEAPEAGATESDESDDESTDGTETGGFKFDMAPVPDLDPPPPPSCKVEDDMNAVGVCTHVAPPDAFEPAVQWEWWGPGDETQSLVIPLVANLTDDNDDGAIDLCDVPDVIVLATDFPLLSHLHVLDGATGAEHFMIPTLVSSTVTPAIGDIDGDGLPEILAAIGPAFAGAVRVIAFEHDGAYKWTSPAAVDLNQGGSIALADLDADGDVEVLLDRLILDHEGALVVEGPAPIGVVQNSAVTAADLDGDGDLEVVVGQLAYHHDGTLYYDDFTIEPGFAQIADLDDDPEPEILVNNLRGITVLEHDGSKKYEDQEPGGTVPRRSPSAVHDFDGDGVAEFAVASPNGFAVYESSPALVWTAPVDDGSGWAAGTAFDFDGDGVAEAMYADELELFVFDGAGTPLLTVPRSARTLTEYPVVVDVDNDGSAEILVVSDAGFDGVQTAPTLQVIRDVDDRWIQARRIWNQHTYHVTNVREDGTIPQFEPPSWASLNTFRTNAQIEAGAVCEPAG